MNKLLFCNEGPVYVDEYGDYYGGALNNQFFEKYYRIADHITICIRVKKIKQEDADQKLTPISLERKTIVPMPDLLSLHGLRNMGEAKRILNREIAQSSIVVVRVPSIIGNLAAKLSKKNNRTYLADVVGCSWDSLFNHSLKGKLIAFPMFLAQRRTVKDADYVIYVTEQFLQHRYPSYGVKTGISDVLLRSVDENILNRRLARIRESKTKLILGTTAAVNVKYKGQDRVIKTLGELKKKGISNFEYQLVGGGNTSYIEKVIEKNNVRDQVKLLGPMPHQNVFDWLDSIDIYIQPSFQEGLSRALIEAMSRALPCIASDAGGNPELVAQEWVYKRNHSVKNLENKLLQLNKTCLEEMAISNFQKAKNFIEEDLEGRRNEFYTKIKVK